MLTACRKYKHKDFSSIVDMLDEEWDLGKQLSETPQNKICARIYAHHCRAVNSFSYTLVHCGRIIGYIGINILDSKRRSLKSFYHKWRRKSLLRKIKNQAGLEQYYNTYTYSPNYGADCELELFIIRKDYRSQGYGKFLFETVMRECAKRGLSKLKIDSDESCNYGIYEKFGAVLKYKQFVNSSEHLGEGENVFTYLYDIKQENIINKMMEGV